MGTVDLDRVKKLYPHGVVAVEELSLTVHDAEFVVLVGPSGCGKTTTLRLIAGLEHPTSGVIRIGGEIANDLPPRQRDVAMVFQNYALYPHLTVYSNLAFGLGWKRSGARARPSEERLRVGEVAKTLGLTALLDRMPRELSGGERQRVALGRALARRPRVFLFDEPLSGMDGPMRAETRRQLKELQRQLATAMVYVTHDQAEAMSLGDRVVVMHRGVVQQVDEPGRVYGEPCNRFVAGFMGSPPMNLLEGSLRRDAEVLRFETDGLDIPLPRDNWPGALAARERPVVLGVRPEDIRVGRTGAEGDATLRGRVAATEWLGYEQIVYVHVGTQLLTVRTDARSHWEHQELLELGIAMTRIHWFDGESGARIAPGDRSPDG